MGAFRKAFLKIPYKGRSVIASPLVAVMIAMMFAEMFGRTVRASWYLIKDACDPMGNPAGDFMRYMYKRRE